MNLNILFFLFILNLFLFQNLDKISKKLNFYDKPDANRKKHITEVPNIGGFFFIFNLFFFLIFEVSSKNFLFFYFFNHYELYYFFIFSLFLFFIGAYDDKVNLKPSSKLLYLFLVIIFYLILNKEILITTLRFSFINYKIYHNFFLSLFITSFFILLFINAFNMFDGINCLAALYFFLILFLSSLYINNFSIVLAVFPFIFFFLINNFRNKIFLGDNGSILLGFFLSIIFIKYYNLEIIFFSDQIFIFMMIPGFDLLRLSVVRILNNRHPFLADRNHLHHIMLNRYGYLKSLCWIFFLITFPIIILFLLDSTIISVLFGLLLYILTIFLCNR